MRVLVLTFFRQDIRVIAIFSAIAVVLAFGVMVQVSGARPYGEQAILEQIDREDSALCQKFGFAASTPESADCMLNLTDLRQHHVDLLQSYSWL
jgi:hypothetical protein